jgi:hypothetical protein
MNDKYFCSFVIHREKSKLYLKAIKSNSLKTSMRFDKNNNYFILNIKEYNSIPYDEDNCICHSVKKGNYISYDIEKDNKYRVEEKTKQCPNCNDNIRNPELRDTYLEYPRYPDDYFQNYTPFLDCHICSLFNENITKAKKNILTFPNNINYIYTKKWCKTIIYDYCYICGQPNNSCNEKINCKNNDHAKKRIENYHKKITIFLKKYLSYLLGLEKLSNLYNLELSNKLLLLNDEPSLVSYQQNKDKMHLLAFHLETNLFFIKNPDIFKLVLSYRYYDCFTKIAEDLIYYFSDKYFTVNSAEFYDFQSKNF